MYILNFGGDLIIELVGIDMDETLLRSDKSFDRERFKEIYKEFQKKGIVLVIATGNPYPKLNEYFSYMNHDQLYLASDNGNYLVKGKELLYKNSIDHDNLVKAVNYLEKMDTLSVVFSDGKKTYSKWVNPEYEEYVRSFNKNLEIIHSIEEIKDKAIVKVAVHSDLPLDEAKKLSVTLMEKFENLDSVTSGGGWLDFYRQGGGKGSAIADLQKKYQIQPENTIIFGDSLNDASMVEHAKYSVAMANGDQALKEITNYEIGSNNQQAVLDILENYLAKESIEFMNQYKSNKS